MTRYWTELARRLTPYVPGEQRTGANIVKLNTNENPYPPSPDVLNAISAVGGDALRRYPDPDATALRESLATYHGVLPEQVFVGNGSDEILAMAFMAFFTGDKPLQFPDISYSFYPVYCDLLDITASTVPLDDDYACNSQRSSGIWVALSSPTLTPPPPCRFHSGKLKHWSPARRIGLY